MTVPVGAVAAALLCAVGLLLLPRRSRPRRWAPVRRPSAPAAGATGGHVVGGRGPRAARAGRAHRSEPVERAARARRGTGRPGDTGSLLALLGVVAPSLRAGRTPEESMRLACGVVEGGGVLTPLREAAEEGRSIDGALERLSRRHADARLVAHAWALSARTGCPLADAVECAARLVRSRLAHRRRIETAATGARATIRILTMLPVGGPLLALAVGVDPVRAYLTAPAAWVCLATGGVLVLAGRAWVERLVSDVTRGPVLG